jgi:hypothetical protein
MIPSLLINDHYQTYSCWLAACRARARIHPLNSFNTIVGEIRFDELGEWKTPRMLVVQFQNVQGSELDQYLTGHRQVILYPAQYKDGELEQPFAK